jgi:hypothetical protein
MLVIVDSTVIVKYGLNFVTEGPVKAQCHAASVG